MFDQCLYFNSTALARQLEREWATAFRPFGLTPPQAFMLRTILASPALLQRELAAAMGIARPTATRTLDGLQTLKLIERRATERDGREYAIFPTAKAQSLQDQLNAASGEVTKRLKRSLGAAQFEKIVTTVRSARKMLA